MTGIITRDPEVQRICRTIEKVAPTSASVLILGESGTGKELLARALHDLSPRKDQPLRRDQLRGHPREPARERAVRLREGRVHRRGEADDRQVRNRRQRHALPRRNRRPAARAAGEAAAFSAGARDRACRRQAGDPGRRADRLRDPPEPQGPDRGREISRRPLLPASGDRRRDSAAARAQGRCRAARACVRPAARRRTAPRLDEPAARCDRRHRIASVARQRARARERHQARGDHERRRR